MRILRISLRNIASLAGTHTVDFTREPLRSAGLFAISGPTGSGKSSLLDALCLALYDDTPRLSPVGRLAELANGEKQNDPRNLLRRGTAEGFAEVAFVGVDHQTYTARWSVRRSRNKADGALQSAEMALYRGDIPPGSEGPLEQGGKKTEVREAIDKRLGLTFAQFTRAVLLAQNDFATFLKADDKDRAEILQALTGTERFEEISRAVFVRCRSEETAVAEIEHRLTGNAPLSPEDRAAAEARAAAADLFLKETEIRLANSEKHAAWFHRQAELTLALTNAGAALMKAGEQRGAAAPRRSELAHTSEAALHARPLRDAENSARSDLTTADAKHTETLLIKQSAGISLTEKQQTHATAAEQAAAAKSAREAAQPLLLKARELDATLAPLKAGLEKANLVAGTAANALRAVQEKRDTLRAARDGKATEHATVQTKFAALASFQPFARDATAWLDRLDTTAASRTTAEKAASALRKVAAEVANQEAQLAKEKATAGLLQTIAEETRAALATAETAASVFDGEQIAAERITLDAAHQSLTALLMHLREVQRLISETATLDGEVTTLETQKRSDADTLAEVSDKHIPLAELELTAAREVYTQTAAVVDAASVRLRELLRPGQACPVCGAADHPFAAHPPLEEAMNLRGQQQRITEREKTRDEWRGKLQSLQAGIKLHHDQIAQKSAQRQWLAEQLTQQSSARHDHAECAAVVALPEASRLPVTEERLQFIQQRRGELEAADTKRRAAEKRLHEARLRSEKAAKTHDALTTTLHDLEKKLAVARAAHEAAQTEAGKASGQLTKSLTDLELLLHGLPDGPKFAGDAPGFRRWFAAGALDYVSLEKRLGELASAVLQDDAALVPLEQNFNAAKKTLADLQTEAATAAATHAGVETQRAEIFAGRPATDMEAELDAVCAEKERTLKECEAAVTAADRILTTVEETLKSAVSARAIAQDRLSAATDVLEKWLTAFSARTGRSLDRAGLEGLLARDEVWREAELSALTALDDAVKTAEGALKAHQDHLAKHREARPAADDEFTVTAALESHRIAKEAAMTELTEASAMVRSDDQRRATNASLADELTARRAKTDPWIKLNDLIGSADGAKFRSIAQRRTLDILLGYANAQLELLAARYRLERLPESLNLIVLDRDMGDERRGVHSLSGGESFLVSLALALGLASLTSNRLRIESLFIDEGFGSLDAETLNTAMSALMHLEAQGRKVGVISHVTEMADAIPVQIRIVKGRGGASRLVVPGAEPEPEPAVSGREPATAELASRMLNLLEAAGGKLSAVALRKELGCSEGEFKAARESLGTQVLSEGRSLRLAEPQSL